jgi:hypothetical protein
MKQQKKRTVRTALEAARAIIRDKKHWTQGEFYRTARGQALTKPGPSAEKFCALGAIHQVTDDGAVRQGAEQALFDVAGGGGMILLNDGRTGAMPGSGVKRTRSEAHKAVLDAYGRAIKAVSG